MEIESLFGLPAHPLLVHAIVVLVPVVAIGVVACSGSASTRRALAVPTFGLAVGVTVLVPFVTGSGEELEDAVERTEAVRDHAAMGDTFLVFALFLLAGAGLVLWRWRTERRGHEVSGSRAMRIGMTAAAVALALVPTVRIVQVGHSGAKATWRDVGREERAGD